MKTIRFIFTALLAGLFFAACEEKPIDELSGIYDNIDRYHFTEVQQQPTEKLGKGIKALPINFKDAEGNSMEMRIGSADWAPKAGIYTATRTLAADKTFSAVLGDKRKVVSGNLNINLIDGMYIFSGLLATEDGSEIQCNYRGALSFEVGVDDPEPSGYTTVLTVQPVFQTDQSGQVTGVVPGVAKYTFVITDPNGAEAAMFETVNTENLQAPALAGTYEVKDTAEEPLSMASGTKLPAEWGGWSWGSYAVNSQGTKEFLQAGSRITVSVAQSSEGEMLYSFSGSGLKTMLTMNGDGSITAGSLTEIDIRFSTLQQAAQ